MTWQPCTRPTLHFIGVSTAQSSIMRVFPAWARHLGLGDAGIHGIDFPLHADPAAYREAVTFIRNDPLSLGALVTTHKIDLFAACRDLFDEIDPFAALMHEVSCLSKRDGRLIAHAKDPLTAGLAVDGLLGSGYWARSGGAEAFVIGAGGSAIALTWHLMRPERAPDRPARLVVSDRSEARLTEIRHIHARIGSTLPVDYHLVTGPADNDALLAGLRPGSLVVNATGLGKDAPGSPLTDRASFPEGAIAWDLNYRGDLIFLDQARAQAASRGVTAHDGWTYFIHGWAQVIAEVFAIPIDPGAESLAALTAIARHAARGGA